MDFATGELTLYGWSGLPDYRVCQSVLGLGEDGESETGESGSDLIADSSSSVHLARCLLLFTANSDNFGEFPKPY